MAKPLEVAQISDYFLQKIVFNYSSIVEETPIVVIKHQH